MMEDEEPQGGHAIGWDGCPSCFDCKTCNAKDGDCCDDCTYDSRFHSRLLPNGGEAVGITYSNQACKCKGHAC